MNIIIMSCTEDARLPIVCDLSVSCGQVNPWRIGNVKSLWKCWQMVKLTWPQVVFSATHCLHHTYSVMFASGLRLCFMMFWHANSVSSCMWNWFSFSPINGQDYKLKSFSSLTSSISKWYLVAKCPTITRMSLMTQTFQSTDITYTQTLTQYTHIHLHNTHHLILKAG